MAYEIKKTLWKAFTVFLFGGVTALLGFIEGMPFQPNQALWAGLVIAILRGIQDYLKHRTE